MKIVPSKLENRSQADRLCLNFYKSTDNVAKAKERAPCLISCNACPNIVKNSLKITVLFLIKIYTRCLFNVADSQLRTVIKLVSD